MSKSTQVLLFAVAGLVGLGAWLVSGGARESVMGPEPQSGEGGEFSAPSAHLDEVGSEAPSREDLLATNETPVAQAVTRAVPDFVPYTTRKLRGRLTLLDEFGNGPFLESGTFGFWLWQRDEATYHEVEVQRGVWETILPSDVRISLGEVELGGHVAAFQEREGVPTEVPLSGYLELEAYLPKKTVLRVFDFQSGTELNEVTVAVERGREIVGLHPGTLGAENMVLEGGSSPIVVEALPGIRIDREVDYFVKARGYAWKKLRLQHSVGGTYQVGLFPAGAISVKISEYEPGLFPVFRLWSAGLPFLERPLEWEREFLIEDLDEGHYLASVDIGSDHRKIVRLGSVPVDVHPGGTTSIELNLDAGPEYARGDLMGTVIIPAEWGLDSFRLLLRLKSEVASERESLRLASNVELADIEGRRDAWQFRFPELIAGKWSFGVEPTLFATEIQVSSDPQSHLEILVPPPADWVVRTVDPHSGEPALIEELRFNVVGGYTSEMRLAEPGTRPGEFLVRAPQGTVQLVTTGAGYRGVRQTALLNSDEGELELEVPSRCGVEVRLYCNGDAVLWKREARVTLARMDGTGSHGREQSDVEVLTIETGRPGDFTLNMEPLVGFAAVPERRVSVDPASFTSVEIELVRE